MSKINYHFNYISNILGFPKHEKQLVAFQDLLKLLSSEYTYNSKKETERLHLVVSFWAVKRIGVGISKRITYTELNKSSEINIAVLLPSKNYVDWGVKSINKTINPVDARYFNFVELQDKLQETKSMDEFLSQACNEILKILIENKVFSSK